MNWLIDRLVNTGILDRWRGKRSWLGRIVFRADVRALKAVARAMAAAARASKEYKEGR